MRASTCSALASLSDPASYKTARYYLLAGAGENENILSHLSDDTKLHCDDFDALGVQIPGMICESVGSGIAIHRKFTHEESGTSSKQIFIEEQQDVEVTEFTTVALQWHYSAENGIR